MYNPQTLARAPPSPDGAGTAPRGSAKAESGGSR